MTRPTERTRAFFALPPERVDDARAWHEEWSQALDARRDDRSVIANQLYLRLDEIALHRVYLVGDIPAGAGLAAMGHLSSLYRRWWDQTVLGPEECVELAETLVALEARYSSEKVLYMRMRRHTIGGDVSLEDMAVAYAGFKEVVHWAVDHRAGFAEAAYWPGAEERLAKERREEEERRREAANMPRYTPEEEAAIMAELQAKLDRMVEEGYRRQWDFERAREREIIGSTQRELYLVPADSVKEIRSLLLQSRLGGKARVDALRARASGCALETLAFEGPNERYALEQLLSIARHEDHLPRDGGGKLVPMDKVLAMAANLSEWWREFRPMARAMKVLSILSNEAPHDACERAYRGFSELLARIRRRRKRYAGAVLLMLLVAEDRAEDDRVAT